MESSDLHSLLNKKDGETKPSNGLERDGHRDDTALIQGCLDGDETAWKDLVTRYGRLVYSIPRRYGLSAADADDVFQNVFTIVYRYLPHLHDQTRLAAWLITITHREAKRVSKHLPASAELDEAAEDGNDPPLEQVQALERQHLVLQALEQMGSPCRELLTALFLDPDPLSYEKLAARLGIPVGSIGPTRARCFKKLESILLALGVDLD